MVGFLRFIIYRAIYSAVKGWRGEREGWRNPRDAIAMNMESGEQRERRFYECSVGYGSKPRSHDTTAIFAMLIISRDFIMDDVPMLVVESIEKPSPCLLAFLPFSKYVSKF